MSTVKNKDIKCLLCLVKIERLKEKLLSNILRSSSGENKKIKIMLLCPKSKDYGLSFEMKNEIEFWQLVTKSQ